MRLYTYHRSSASYRVRIGLEWKGIDREDRFVDLGKGQQLEAAYLEENPEGRVPLLVDGDVRLGQALAILEYLEEKVPEPPLLPKDLAGRARVRQLALLVVADIQPLQNTGPLVYLGEALEVSDPLRFQWYKHWVHRGLSAFEAHLARDPATGRFCHGDAPTLADVCVVPQLVNWCRNAGGDLSEWPHLARVFEACQALEAFQRAAPERQPDSPDAPPQA
ncbi:MAG: maleylacetoacetate isomerase [Myxococcota bacterium]|nr:maleylacetoacetate isomerase [Myxococcota bacterium]